MSVELTKQELLDAITKAVGGEKKVKEEGERQVDEAAEALDVRISKIEEKLAEPEVDKKVELVVPGEQKIIPVRYRGYVMDEQWKGLENHRLFAPQVQILDEEQRDRITKFLIDFVRSEIYGDIHAKTALSEGVTTQGGYLVPDEYEATILAFARLISFALTDCRIWTMGTDTLRVPSEASGATTYWTAEATGLTESTGPTVSEVTLSATRLGAFKEASKELINDSMVDIVSWLTELMAEAVGQELDNKVIQGTGTPWIGILHADGVNRQAGPTGTGKLSDITADTLSDALAQLSSNKLANAKWYWHRSMFNIIRKLKDNNNDYIFAKPGQGVPGTVWEYPYVLVEEAPAYANDSTAGQDYAVFGDMRNFQLGRRSGSVALFANPYSLDKEGQIRFTVESRWGGAIGLPAGFVKICAGDDANRDEA